MDSGYGLDSNFVRACLVALGLLCGLLQGCGGGPSDPPPVVLRSISVSPSAPQLALGVTQQFTANGTFSDGTTGDVSSQVTWTSSSPTVASIVSGGLAKAVGVGSTQIQAGSNSVSGSTTLQVTAAVLSQINVTPAQASLVMNSWEAAPTQQFRATGDF